MFVDACSGGGFRGVEIGVEAVKAVVDVFLPGGYAAIRLADPRNVVLIDMVDVAPVQSGRVPAVSVNKVVWGPER